MLLYGFVGNADGFSQFSGGVFRMDLEKVKDFLPTFLLFLPTDWCILPTFSRRFQEQVNIGGYGF
jgi:hypothetical protein